MYQFFYFMKNAGVVNQKNLSAQLTGLKQSSQQIGPFGKLILAHRPYV